MLATLRFYNTERRNTTIPFLTPGATPLCDEVITFAIRMSYTLRAEHGAAVPLTDLDLALGLTSRSSTVALRQLALDKPPSRTERCACTNTCRHQSSLTRIRIVRRRRCSLQPHLIGESHVTHSSDFRRRTPRHGLRNRNPAGYAHLGSEWRQQRFVHRLLVHVVRILDGVLDVSRLY